MDFLKLLQRLTTYKVEYVVVGGYASMLLGSDMLTQDLDVCVRLGSENLGKVYDALEPYEPRYRMHPKRPLITREMLTESSIKNAYFSTTVGSIDCLGNVLGLGDFQEVAKYARDLKLDFGVVRTLDFEGMIRAKEAMSREKDALTVAKLKAIQERMKSG